MQVEERSRAKGRYLPEAVGLPPGVTYLSSTDREGSEISKLAP